MDEHRAINAEQRRSSVTALVVYSLAGWLVPFLHLPLGEWILPLPWWSCIPLSLAIGGYVLYRSSPLVASADRLSDAVLLSFVITSSVLSIVLYSTVFVAGLLIAGP